MIVIFGKRMMGKCDRVPGFFHVATQFFHIDYVPLIPLQSWVVISENGKQFRGVKIPLSGKSILCAWGRMISLVAAIIFAVVAIVQIAGGRAPLNELLIPLIGAVLCGSVFAFLILHRSCTHASFYRASQLGQLVGLTQAGQEQLQRIYGEQAGRGFEVVPMGNFHDAAGFDSNSPDMRR